MSKRSRTDNAGSSVASRESEHVALQAEYIKDSALASQGFMEHIMHEARNIDIATADFAESEIDFEGITKVMKYAGPEEEGRSIKASMMLHTAEGVITMSKVAEVFLMDLALKAWQARDIETPAELKSDSIVTSAQYALPKHEINAAHLQRAIRTHEEFDFLADSAYSYGLRDSFLQKEVSEIFERPIVKSSKNPAANARGGSLQQLPMAPAAPAAPPPKAPEAKAPAKSSCTRTPKTQEPAGWRGLQITSTGAASKVVKKTPPNGDPSPSGKN